MLFESDSGSGGFAIFSAELNGGSGATEGADLRSIIAEISRAISSPDGSGMKSIRGCGGGCGIIGIVGVALAVAVITLSVTMTGGSSTDSSSGGGA